MTILPPYTPPPPPPPTAILPPYNHGPWLSCLHTTTQHDPLVPIQPIPMAILPPYNHSPWLHTTTPHGHFASIQPLTMAILPPYNHSPWPSCFHTTTHNDCLASIQPLSSPYTTHHCFLIPKLLEGHEEELCDVHVIWWVHIREGTTHDVLHSAGLLEHGKQQ